MKFSFSIILIFLALTSFGQKFSDNDSLFWNLPLQKKLHFHYDNPNMVKFREHNYNIGEAELSFQHREGNYRRAQQAHLQNIANFKADGISQIDKFVVSGSFQFDKVWEDSLANTLQGEMDDLSPFYFFVQKAGKYERQNFVGNVNVRYAGKFSLLQPGIVFKYHSHWTTRSVDPRPNVASVAIKFNPYITAQLQNHQLSLGFSYGYGDEENTITYKNRMFSTSMLYPERIYYTNQGFGFISQRDSSSLRRYDTYLGGNLGYTLEKEYLQLYSVTSFERKVTNSTYDTKLRQRYFKRSEFTLQSVSHNTLLMLNKNVASHILELNAAYHNGRDYNYNLRAANYLVKYYNVELDYSYTNERWSWGGSTAWSSMEKTDAASAHHHQYSLLSLSINAKRFWHIADHILETELRPQYTFKLNNKLSVPSTQVNLFTTSVVYPDFDYFNLEPLMLHLNIAYNIPSVMKLRGMRLFLRNQILTFVNKSEKETMSLPVEDAQMWQVQAGIQFSL
ncbi:DUF6850 family outer membrane beta-barrel protein [Sphingobacterium thermophilum]|uniref:DUF6850 domain-containing protein n=1 Tax=Sphingobacterium thermophilum TaxID=768534 RepID=A0ABP8QZ25_9SPHI